MDSSAHCKAARALAGRRQVYGVTLIELMVTVAVAAILMAIAAPSFTSVLNSNRLTGAANELVAAIQAARMESVRTGQRVTVCGSANGQTCAGSGAMIVVAADGTVLREVHINPKVRTGDLEIVFRPDGFAHAADGSLASITHRFCIATKSPAENVRNVGLVAGSRVSTSSSTGACQ